SRSRARAAEPLPRPDLQHGLGGAAARAGRLSFRPALRRLVVRSNADARDRRNGSPFATRQRRVHVESIRRILVALDRGAASRQALPKAIALARRLGASLELFLCDAERAFVLQRAYDARAMEDMRAAFAADARKYLEELRSS